MTIDIRLDVDDDATTATTASGENDDFVDVESVAERPNNHPRPSPRHHHHQQQQFLEMERETNLYRHRNDSQLIIRGIRFQSRQSPLKMRSRYTDGDGLTTTRTLEWETYRKPPQLTRLSPELWRQFVSDIYSHITKTWQAFCESLLLMIFAYCFLTIIAGLIFVLSNRYEAVQFCYFLLVTAPVPMSLLYGSAMIKFKKSMMEILADFERRFRSEGGYNMEVRWEHYSQSAVVTFPY